MSLARLHMLLAGTLLATSAVAGGDAGASLNVVPPYRSATPIESARIFSAGIISTPSDEFGGQFSRDGRTFWFSRSVPRFQIDIIFTSDYRDGRWNTPRIAPFSGQWHDYDPTLSVDGTRMYFISDRTRAGGNPQDHYDVWYLDTRGNGWSEPKNLGAPINGNWSSHFAVSTRSGTLYFTSDRPGSKGGLDVWRSHFINGHYQEPENMGDAINDENWANYEVYVDPDETYMIVSAYGHDDGYGDCDLYVSYHRDGQWLPLQNMGPSVNSAARDYSARVTPDGKYLFFTSERGVPTDARTAPWTYREFTHAVRGVRNGLGNIYQIDLKSALPTLAQ